MKRAWIGLLVVAIAAAIYLWPRDRDAPTSGEAAAPATAVAKPRDRKALARATIAGTVHDEAGKPLAGARACIVGEDETPLCAASGADGRFTLAGVIADDVQLATQLATYLPRVLDVALLAAGEVRTVDVELLSGGFELRGTVEDVFGGPIERAQVTTHGARVDTDASGKFAIWIGSPDRMRMQPLEVRAAGYGPRREFITSLDPLTIALFPESSIAGKVVDAATGAPVAQARVIATPGGEATSGSDGSFVIEGLATGTVRIEASTPARFGTLAGTVQLGVGERIDDVVVPVHPAYTLVATLEVEGDRQHCSPAPQLTDWSLQVAKPWRDEAGRYHFEGLPRGVYTPELGCGEQVAPVVIVDRDVEATWTLSTGGTIKGKIELAQQYPRARRIDLRLTRTDARRTPRAETGAATRYEIQGVPAGTYTLEARVENEVLATLENIVVANGATVVRDIAAKLENRGEIAGTVTFQGQPASAMVWVTDVRANLHFSTKATNGRFEIDVPEGDYHVSAHGLARGEAPGLVGVKVAARTKVDIVLDEVIGRKFDATAPRPKVPPAREYTFTGQVLDGAHIAIANAVVVANVFDLGRLRDTPAIRVQTRDDGTFSFVAKLSEMEADVFRIGGVSASARLEAGKPATIVLARDATVSGTVTLPDGTPARRFQVRVGAGTKTRTETFDYTGGRFTVRHDGTYPVVLTALVNGIAGAPVSVVQGDANITLKLPATVTITGRIVDGETRKGIGQVKIAGRQSVGDWGAWFIHRDQVTDADGRFTLREVPPGPVRLELTPPLESWSGQMVNITVPDKGGDIGELGLAQARKR